MGADCASDRFPTLYYFYLITLRRHLQLGAFFGVLCYNMLMPEKDTNAKTEPKEHPVISHFGDKPIHPKSDEKSAPDGKKARAKLNDPDFAGKKAVKKTSNPKTKLQNAAQVKTPKNHVAKTDISAPQKAKTKILERTEIKPVEKSAKTVEKPVENIVEKSENVIENPESDTAARVTEEPEKNLEKPKKAPLRPRRHTIPAVIRIPFAIALLVGTSLLFTWYTFLRQYGWNFDEVSDFMVASAGQYYLTWGIIFCLMSLVAAVTWKVFFTVGATFSLLSILTFINSQKLAVRDAPFLPDDLRMAGNLGQVASYADQDAIMRLAAGVVFVLAGTILMEIFVKRAFGRDPKKLPWWERHSVIPRLTYGAIALAGLVSVTTPLLRQQPADWVQGMELVGWNQTINYESNGIIIGFVNNLGRMEIPQPDNYSGETMQKIAERYEAKRAEDMTARKPLTEVADRVIVILDETFYDPALLTKYYPHNGGDVLPNLHKLFQNYPSGYMYSPEYGGNTANIEFEVQTGLSNYWAGTIPYVTTVTKTAGLTSVASIARSLGYETTAIHSYDGTMYKRNLVYPLLGYNDFISRDEMKHTNKEPGPQNNMYLNDQAVFQEVLDVLKDGPERQMVNVVTMQNHSPYWLAEYPKLEFTMKNSKGEDGGDYSRSVNFQSLHEADKYVAEFLADLDKSDEKTVVLWFGDHAAGLFEKYTESDNKTDRDTIHLTPYFIWTNFEIADLYTTAEVKEHNAKLGITIPSSIRGVNLPTTTPNCLQNTMYNLLKVEKPAFFYLLDEVCATAPILAHTYLEDDGPAKTQTLTDYELVNYDAMAGKQYWKYE